MAQGGLYIKAAQLVASLQGGAGEALPKEYVEEFRSLTDAVPPRSFGDVRAVAEADLGQPLVPDLVASVDAWPIAAASLAQVHRAVPLLRQSSSEQLVENCTPQDSKLGETLALKLQYPNLKDQLSSDLAVMKQMAPFVRPAGKDVGWLLDDIERFVFRELDFRNEASNAEVSQRERVLTHLRREGGREGGIRIIELNSTLWSVGFSIGGPCGNFGGTPVSE